MVETRMFAFIQGITCISGKFYKENINNFILDMSHKNGEEFKGSSVEDFKVNVRSILSWSPVKS